LVGTSNNIQTFSLNFLLISKFEHYYFIFVRFVIVSV
jgi:hypothetical protein